MARCSTPGPLCGGEAEATGRSAGADRDVGFFSPGQATAWMPELRQRRSGCPTSGRKARPRLTNLPGRMPGKRQAGCRFLLGTALLDKQKRSTSGDAGARKLLLSRPSKATQLAPVNPLPRPHAKTRPGRRSVRRPAMASGNTTRHRHSPRQPP